MKVAQTRTAWLYAKTEDVDKLGGLSMKTRSDESTVDQLKHGTDALFSSISAETRPNFIRCINPKRAGEPVAASMRERFAQQHVLQQLKTL
jgi:myosin heavy subunit